MVFGSAESDSLSMLTRQKLQSVCRTRDRIMDTDKLDDHLPAYKRQAVSLGDVVARVTNRSSCLLIDDNDVDRYIALARHYTQKYCYEGEKLRGCHCSPTSPMEVFSYSLYIYSILLNRDYK